MTSTSRLPLLSHILSWMSPSAGEASTCLPTNWPGPRPSMNSDNWPSEPRREPAVNQLKHSQKHVLQHLYSNYMLQQSLNKSGHIFKHWGIGWGWQCQTPDIFSLTRFDEKRISKGTVKQYRLDLVSMNLTNSATYDKDLKYQWFITRFISSGCETTYVGPNRYCLCKIYFKLKCLLRNSLDDI